MESKYGDDLFAELVDGQYTPGGTGTTCPYLPAAALFYLGCRDPGLVNRDDPEGLTKFEYGDKTNGISKLYYGGKAAGCWVDDGPGREPQEGDIYYVIGPEHVGHFCRQKGGIWHTGDSGQGTHLVQEAKYVDRPVRDDRARGGHRYIGGPNGDMRQLMGWVDLDRVPLTAPPSGPAAEEEEEPGTSTGAVVAGVAVGVLALGLFGAAVYASRQPELGAPSASDHERSLMALLGKRQGGSVAAPSMRPRAPRGPRR